MLGLCIGLAAAPLQRLVDRECTCVRQVVAHGAIDACQVGELLGRRLRNDPFGAGPRLLTRSSILPRLKRAVSIALRVGSRPRNSSGRRIAMSRKRPLTERISTESEGAGDAFAAVPRDASCNAAAAGVGALAEAFA
jgi:hypothetical protein